MREYKSRASPVTTVSACRLDNGEADGRHLRPVPTAVPGVTSPADDGTPADEQAARPAKANDSSTKRFIP
jgi:hypothetical protein